MCNTIPVLDIDHLKFRILTKTCPFVKFIKNKASGTEALLHSINDCTGARATTITSTGLIGCSENRVAVMTSYSTVLCVYSLKNK